MNVIHFFSPPSPHFSSFHTIWLPFSGARVSSGSHPILSSANGSRSFVVGLPSPSPQLFEERRSPLLTESRTGERTQRQLTATGLCSEGTSSLCWSPIMASAHRLTVRSGVGIQTELKYNEGKPNALRIPFPSSIRLGSSKHTAITTKAAVLARAATSADVAVSSPTYVDQEDFAKAGGSELDFALLQAAKEMDDQAKISKTVMRLKSPLSAL